MSVAEHLRIFGANQGLTGAALNDAVTRWMSAPNPKAPGGVRRTWTAKQRQADDARREHNRELQATFDADRTEFENWKTWPRGAPDPKEFVAPAWDVIPELEGSIPWRFELDPDLLDSIGCSLDGGGIAREVLEQLPRDLGPLELAGYGRPWQSGELSWIELSDDQATKAARTFARATSGTLRGRYDRLRIRPGQEERVGPRRRRSRVTIVPEISVELDHWRDAP